eukprot:CAMPEP_0113943482 /NCGR_PEP_ID=MMETSP1339-20121228/24783_1 /TAXON_ID=94617 /ORGANISM="Fibrocapsa japonica" /LENGTH=79 /DNA_ID=CAMNT_0000948365 /DNA_START=197 /DNA_END=437 /DNA_ORIENTATION=- /assembly_acc=CAM_ASM_000762
MIEHEANFGRELSLERTVNDKPINGDGGGDHGQDEDGGVQGGGEQGGGVQEQGGDGEVQELGVQGRGGVALEEDVLEAC